MNMVSPKVGSAIAKTAIFAGWLRHKKQNVPNITNKLTPTKIVWNVVERRFGATWLRLAVQHTIPGHESGANKLSHHAERISNKSNNEMTPEEIQRSAIATCSGTERRNTPAMVGAKLASIAFPPIELGAVTGARKRASSAP
jgi:hypothetical protein